MQRRQFASEIHANSPFVSHAFGESFELKLGTGESSIYLNELLIDDEFSKKKSVFNNFPLHISESAATILLLFSLTNFQQKI